MEIDSWDQIVTIDESQSFNFDQYLIIHLMLNLYGPISIKYVYNVLHHFPTVDNPDPNLIHH